MDPGLIERARAGDPDAWRALLEQHAPKLRLYVEYRLGRSLARCVEVEDVVQETLLRAWRGLAEASIAGDRAMGGWLAAIARNVVIDIARARRTARRRGPGRDVSLDRSAWSSPGSIDPGDSTAGPLTRAVRGEEAERLLAAYRSLPPHYQRVIALRQLEQRSAREAAPQLGCTEAAVHALFRRALDAWGAALDGAPPGGT